MEAVSLSLTPAAAARIKHLIEQHGGDALGIRLGIKTAGCSGLTYKLDFANAIGERDEVVELDGAKVVIDAEAMDFVSGTEMDYVESKLGANFTFKNPHEKARCGCGESFTT
ncbi:MAG: iron-sulfur cluster assembly accessory protein [Pseudomonadota bacterium]